MKSKKQETPVKNRRLDGYGIGQSATSSIRAKVNKNNFLLLQEETKQLHFDTLMYITKGTSF